MNNGDNGGDDDLKPSFEQPVPHYYGDIVRKQLILAGIAILFATLIDTDLRTFYFFIAGFGVLFFVVLAGLTSPVSRRAIVTASIVSGVMFVLFEYFAVGAYIERDTFFNLVFIIRQTIAVIFLFSVYFSTKTLRGMPGHL